MTLPTPAGRTSLADQFRTLRSENRIGLLPFVPAGYPDLETTLRVLPALESAGATAIEVGIPFSDPIADGPVIQEAFAHSVSRGVRVREIFDTVRAVRAQVSIPLLAMVSYSIIYRAGVEQFVVDARKHGFDGLIIPDLPPPEADEVSKAVRDHGMDTVLLVAPSTDDQRIEQIVRLCSGFVYYLSVSGITGEREQLPPDITANVARIRSMTECPVCVGFGISRKAHVAALRGIADGAIVGSALVRRMKESATVGPEGISVAAAEFCRELLS